MASNWKGALQQVLARGRAAISHLQPQLQRLGQRSQRAWARLRTWVPQHRRAAAAAGITGALAFTLMVAGVPGSPERQVQRAALSGQDLFESLAAEHPGTQRGSRVEDGADRGARTNLVVLAQDVWQGLSVAQRNSIGSWLNTIGGRWEIRVGTASPDGARVLEAEAVVTSREWNQQLK